ncbi:hypothetical protein ORV05_07875 [Amycolatopsis cynarae]|uniref:Uncharacterized protein n=1 Tax=Amycolatopsis cynarae TaxID=2995223 RepID=A0ABY7BAG0_9PSEU|nr:hypothetical protein [Amycolatopsis sp. HUAS 11-8]WAL67688.1 hypothetical protein ORV05_07875 [Amycolatopsis sp. HUAS 11-8]
MSTLYRAIWSDSAETNRRGAVLLARDRVSAWVHESDEAPKLPDGEAVVGQREITVRTLDHETHYGFEFVAVDAKGHGGPNEATWKTEIRVLATDDAIHTWVENGMETKSFSYRPSVGRPRVVDDLLALPGNHRLGTPVLTGVQPLHGNEAEVLVELLRNPARQLPFIVVSEGGRAEGQWQRWAAKIATRVHGVANVITLDSSAVTTFREQLGDLAVWGGGIRTYVPAPLDSPQDGWHHRYVQGKQLLEAEQRMIDRIVYGVTQLSTRRHIPQVFRVFERPDRTIAASELSRIEEDWAERLELEYAERNQVEQDLAHALGHTDRLQREVERLEAKLSWLQRQLTDQGNGGLFWSAPDAQSRPELPEKVADVSEAVLAAQAYLSEDIEIPESAARELDEIDTAPKASAWGNTTWRGLRALAAYAKARRTGFNGDFWIWCQSGEPLAWPATSKALAMKESESVMNSEKLRKWRRLPVSADLDPSGEIEMESHLKVSEGGGPLAPRVYFYDDTGGKTGKVHVGLVGPHYLVPNTKA